MTTAEATATEGTDLSVVACKCCGAAARVYGAVEFNKSCEDRHGTVFAPTGVDIPYHRCSACGFIFTIAFDHFSAGDFRQHIYNDAYVLADPDFVEMRPTANAAMLHRIFGHVASTLRVLDYGGGNGVLTQRLRQLGFAHAETYDPFYEGSQRPEGSFDLVTAFEVMEHTPTPRESLADMASFLSRDAMIFCSTLVQPKGITEFGLTWWYAAPRNGHVSLHTAESLTALARNAGMTWRHANDLLHVFHRGTLPRFASGMLGR